MARFDVHRNNAGDENVPFLVDIQSDLLRCLQTRIVIPLVPLTVSGTPMARLNPVFTIEGELHALATTDLAGVNLYVLGPVVSSLDLQSAEITSAVDFILTGF